MFPPGGKGVRDFPWVEGLQRQTRGKGTRGGGRKKMRTTDHQNQNVQQRKDGESGQKRGKTTNLKFNKGGPSEG